jgi:hypothetical protein
MNNPSGTCPQCQCANTFDKIQCDACGVRLPWANALQNGRQNRYPHNSVRQRSTANYWGFGTLVGLFAILFTMGYVMTLKKPNPPETIRSDPATVVPQTSTPQVSPSTSPTPVQVAQPIPTQTVDAATQRRTAAVELYLDQLQEIGGRIFDAATSINKDSTMNDIVDARATIQQGRVDFMRIDVPPPFVKTNALAEQAFAECELSLQLLEVAVPLRHTQGISKASEHLGNAANLLDRMDKEMGRITDEIRSQPR